MVWAVNALLLKQTTGMYAAAAVMPIAGIKRRGRQSRSRSSDRITTWHDLSCSIPLGGNRYNNGRAGYMTLP